MMVEENPRPLLGIGFNQVQALRDALGWSIGGQALLDQSEQAVTDWLVGQGLKDPRPGVATDSPVSLIMGAMSEYRRRVLGRLSLTVAAISSSLLSPDTKVVGRDRSGTSWSEGAGFCISSAFVRVLGASEQFELDVLKALFFYRPYGKPLGDCNDQEDITVDIEIVTEEPEVKRDVQYYTKPALWTWLKPSAEGNDERRKIFQRVFGLELTPGESNAERKANNKMRKEWYTKRNMVAHGRAGVATTLKEYLDVDAYVTKSMVHLAQRCEENQKLIV